jgi:hypothetical protein
MNRRVRIVSATAIQRIIGILAILFAFLLIAGTRFAGPGYPPSLSQSAWTNAHVIFEGCLVTFGITLWCYKGFDLHDRIVTGISGTSMFGTAFFPCEGSFAGDAVYLFQFLPQHPVAVAHYALAAVAFGSMGYMSAFLFTKGNSGTNRKKIRNIVYRVCGYGIFACLVGLAIVQIYDLRPKTGHLFWWLEAVSVILFGASWLTKSEMWLKDKFYTVSYDFSSQID